RGELREAVTEYTVLKRFLDKKNKFTYVEVRPKTGRTHQIRVHMKFMNHPVACDELYNPGKPKPKGFERLALHAKSISFKNLKGETVKVESPLPEEFKNLL
ncbi:MAG: pseudouridine synthase, partial [Patescibacteria group bacterium]